MLKNEIIYTDTFKKYKQDINDENIVSVIKTIVKQKNAKGVIYVKDYLYNKLIPYLKDELTRPSKPTREGLKTEVLRKIKGEVIYVMDSKQTITYLEKNLNVKIKTTEDKNKYYWGVSDVAEYGVNSEYEIIRLLKRSPYETSPIRIRKTKLKNILAFEFIVNKYNVKINKLSDFIKTDIQGYAISFDNTEEKQRLNSFIQKIKTQTIKEKFKNLYETMTREEYDKEKQGFGGYKYQLLYKNGYKKISDILYIDKLVNKYEFLESLKTSSEYIPYKKKTKSNQSIILKTDGVKKYEVIEIKLILKNKKKFKITHRNDLDIKRATETILSDNFINLEETKYKQNIEKAIEEIKEQMLKDNKSKVRYLYYERKNPIVKARRISLNNNIKIVASKIKNETKVIHPIFDRYLSFYEYMVIYGIEKEFKIYFEENFDPKNKQVKQISQLEESFVKEYVFKNIFKH